MGLEPVRQFLHKVRFKSVNNMMLRHRIVTRMMIPDSLNPIAKGESMETYYLGIDVSKGYADFAILDSEKKQVAGNFQLDDTFGGHSALFNALSEFAEAHPGAQIHAGAESTGAYENNWLDALMRFQGSLPLKVARLNPLGVSANGKAGLCRNVTDSISAGNVAEYMIAHPEKVAFLREDPFFGLRRQWKFIRLLNKQAAQLYNQLESVVYTANPELLCYCRDGFPAWVLKVLAKYPTAANLSRAKAATVAKIPYVTKSRAAELIASARKSVASATDGVTGNLIAATVRQLIALNKTIEDQSGLLEKQCSIPEVQLLKSFKGIGTFSAVGLMMEIESAARFETVKKLAAHFGLHPCVIVSGDGSKKVRMSKKGRKEPRHILYMVALSAIQCNPLIKEIYNERVAGGMERMAAIGYCMHKILRIVYGMLKHGKPFDPEVDRKNREREKNRKKAGRKDKKRRRQDFDSKAPVSRRQNKKRREREQSQDDGVIKRGISLPPFLEEKIT